MKNTIFRIQILALACLSSVASLAAERGYSIDAGVRQTDNIERSLNGTDETILDFGFGLTFSEQTRRISMDIAAVGRYETYVNDVFSDEFVPFLKGFVQITLVEDRLAWVIEDNLGQLARNTFDATSPGNRQNTNFLSTGPDFWLKLGGATVLKISGRYSNSYFELQRADNDRLLGSFDLIREISGSRSISLSGSTERVEFDDVPLNSNYDRQEAYLSYQSEVSRGTVRVEFGGTEIHDREDKSSGFLGRFHIDRKLAGGAVLNVDIGRQFSDSSRIFRANQNAGLFLGEIQDQRASSDPFESSSFDISYDREYDGGTFRVQARWLDEQYERNKQFDRERLSANIEIQRSVSRDIRGVFRARLARYDYGTLSRDDTDSRVSLSVYKQFGRNLSGEIGVERSDRNSSLATEEYDETAGFIRASFSRRFQ